MWSRMQPKLNLSQIFEASRIKFSDLRQGSDVKKFLGIDFVHMSEGGK